MRGLSRHYHDMLMLDRAGVTASALAEREPGRRQDRKRRLTAVFGARVG